MPKHIINLLLILGGALLLAIAAKIYLTDPSFYKYGTYRADAVPQLAAAIPQYKGSAYCQTCHKERFDDWSVGAHKSVQCEVCHGVSMECPVDGKTRIPTDLVRLCTTCHEEMPARPATQPQIVLGEHPFPGEEAPPCHSCHDPHSPSDPQPDAGASEQDPQAVSTTGTPVSVPDVATKCAKCHGKQGQGIKRNPALAGSAAADFIEQMSMYKTGARSHKIMARYAKSLSDEEILDLARYYESLPVVIHE